MCRGDCGDRDRDLLTLSGLRPDLGPDPGLPLTLLPITDRNFCPEPELELESADNENRKIFVMNNIQNYLGSSRRVSVATPVREIAKIKKEEV